MNRARILFVDDEINVLAGLKDMLRKERKRWDLVFALGGEAALEEMGKAHFDIVVSDMRMPGMDGAELLSRVKQEHPEAARMVLSGEAERGAMLRAMPVAQQFLCKPCDADTLRAAITRTHQLHTLLETENVRAAIGTFDKLPSVPRSYAELTAMAADPSKGMLDLASVVERDPAMSAKILQLVNSSYFGMAQRVTSIRVAVSYLGAELLKGLALTANIFAAMEPLPAETFSLEVLRNSSLRSARLAKRFLGKSKHADEAFTAALLKDVGKIVLALRMPRQFAQTISSAAASGKPCHATEKELLGFTHAAVGAYLLGLWGLPFSIVEAVAYHHEPSAVLEGPCDVLAAVHVASVLGGSSLCANQAPLDLEFLDRAGFTAELPKWRAIAAEELSRAEPEA